MLLEKIQFSEKDELYVLGDVANRGPEPIKVLQDMMKRPNIIFILGNHDFIMYTLMKKLSVEITEENIFLVTGHTPTVFIKDWGKTKVYRKNGHIAMDCACVGGGKLAAFCIETEEVIYVDGFKGLR